VNQYPDRVGSTRPTLELLFIVLKKCKSLFPAPSSNPLQRYGAVFGARETKPVGYG
jgi:hypothetical protein